jgi:hypothetical protein
MHSLGSPFVFWEWANDRTSGGRRQQVSAFFIECRYNNCNSTTKMTQMLYSLDHGLSLRGEEHVADDPGITA